LQEVTDQLVILIHGSAADVTGDEAIGGPPKRVFWGERLGIHDVEIGRP
jgi:hypothetical protein